MSFKQVCVCMDLLRAPQRAFKPISNNFFLFLITRNFFNFFFYNIKSCIYAIIHLIGAFSHVYIYVDKSLLELAPQRVDHLCIIWLCVRWLVQQASAHASWHTRRTDNVNVITGALIARDGCVSICISKEV